MEAIKDNLYIYLVLCINVLKYFTFDGKNILHLMEFKSFEILRKYAIVCR